ncbi:hypothetical protein LRS73_33575 (plasmid) [Methylobacterium currus]|uniref:hypothetical protein n=1 Tax=Methylobacterium currus TaxID=2051553 RepID=UPI001E31CCF6|nr:hypothetical protein [Methylobacterium currus]UHC19919.1 hypothetical protein LRS73_33575 [Methylobacterium currus]
MLVASPETGMPVWQDRLSIAMARAATAASRDVRIPADRAVAIGVRIDMILRATRDVSRQRLSRASCRPERQVEAAPAPQPRPMAQAACEMAMLERRLGRGEAES